MAKDRWGDTLNRCHRIRVGELKTTDSQLHDLFEEMESLLLIHDLESGKLLESNSAACKHLGYAKNELAHLSISDICATESGIHPQASRGNSPAEDPIEFEATLRRKDGAALPCKMKASLISWADSPAIMNLCHPTAKNSEAADNLPSELEWQSTFDAVNSPIFLLDPDQRISRCNKAAIDSFAQADGQLIGHHCYEIVHGLSTPLPECPVIRAFKTKKRELLELKRGSSWMEMIVDPILDKEGNILSVVHIVNDITARKNKEEKLLATNELLEESVVTTVKELSAANKHLLQEVATRKAASKELAQSELRYRTLFIGMLNGYAIHEIICNANGRACDYRFLEVNPAFEEMTGLRSENIIGKTVLEVLPETEAYWIDVYGEVALSGKPIRFENYSKALKKHFEVVAFSPRKHQFATAISDITERKRKEAELLRLSHTLKAVGDSRLALLRANEELPYLEEVCKIVAGTCEHALAWIGYADDNGSKSIRPVAHSGFDKDYLQTLKLTWADEERGRGPVGTAVRTGKPCIFQNCIRGTLPLFGLPLNCQAALVPE